MIISNCWRVGLENRLRSTRYHSANTYTLQRHEYMIYCAYWCWHYKTLEHDPTLTRNKTDCWYIVLECLVSRWSFENWKINCQLRNCHRRVQLWWIHWQKHGTFYQHLRRLYVYIMYILTIFYRNNQSKFSSGFKVQCRFKHLTTSYCRRTKSTLWP